VFISVSYTGVHRVDPRVLELARDLNKENKQRNPSVRGLHVEYAGESIKYGILSIFSLFRLPKPLSDQFPVRVCACALCILTPNNGCDIVVGVAYLIQPDKSEHCNECQKRRQSKDAV